MEDEEEIAALIAATEFAKLNASQEPVSASAGKSSQWKVNRRH